MYIDYNYWSWTAATLTFIAIAGLVFCGGVLYVLQPRYRSEDKADAAKERKQYIAAGIGVPVAIVLAVVFIGTANISSNENAAKLQAAVKQTYGLNITAGQAHQLNFPFMNGYPNITLKSSYDAATGTRVSTEQTVFLETADNGRIKLVNDGAPFKVREVASKEYRRINS